MKSTPPIFILGTMRAGTTLLSHILNSHRSIAIGPETQIFRGLDMVLCRRNEYTEAFERGTPYELPPTHERWYERYGVPREEMLSSIRSFLDVFFAGYAERQGKKRWGEKSPWHSYYCDLIRDVYPEAKFVHIVRDPRSVCVSLKAWNHSYEKGARIWDAENRRIRAFGDRVGSESYHLIRYEDLVGDPRASLGKLLEFLGEEWDEAVLHPEEAAAKMEASGKAVCHDGGSRNRACRSIDSRAIGQWKQVLSAAEARKIEGVCGALMTAYGYEPYRPGLNPAAHFPALGRLLTKTKKIPGKVSGLFGYGTASRGAAATV